MLAETATYDLNELARAAGVTTRTVRYYVAQGLLPSPATRGPGTRYDRGHLDRLRLIRHLQRQHFPLAEIRRQLESLDDAGVREVLRSAVEAPSQSSALAYVRGLLGQESDAPAMSSSVLGSPAFMVAESQSTTYDNSEATPARLSEPAPGPSPRQLGRSTWDRIALSPNVELHVRRPLTRDQNRQVAQLMDAAQHIFSEDP